MDVLVERYVFGTDFTRSKMYIDGDYFCEVIERYDAGLNEKSTLKDIQDAKKRGLCAIPYGTYTVKLSYSKSFGRVLPLIENVLGFLGVRIHEGNAPQNSKGCLLVGKLTNKQDFISNSKETLMKLMEKMKDEKNISLTIKKYTPENQ